MAIAIKIKGKNFSRLSKKMSKASKEIADQKKNNMKAVILLDGWVKKNFKKAGALHEDGSLIWPALEKNYANYKKRIGKNSGILQRDLHLRNNWDLLATKEYGILRSRTEYGYYHEEGIGQKKRKILPEEKQAFKIIEPVYRKSLQLFKK